MPEDVLQDYNEARQIFNASPRGAAALLRLAIQKLCIALGKNGKNLNNDIGELVKAGLSSEVQKALDIVRVIGNESMHPGTIDINDDRETAAALFGLVNFIVEKCFTEPRKINELYQKLPEAKVKSIEKRDS